MSSNDTSLLDRQAPIPYIRSKGKKEFEVPTVKFEFEREETKTVQKEQRNTANEPTGTITEVSTFAKDHKVTLKTFAHSSDEDGEHWIDALETLQKEMDVEWTKASKAKKEDATVLFQAMDKILLHSANAEWMDTMARYDKKNPDSTDKTWEKFKLCVCDFTTRVVFKYDAYDRQKSYLQERSKPYDLNAKEWFLRLETLSRMLPWLIPNVGKLQKETISTANWKDLWVLGYLSEAEKRRIILTKMPGKWYKSIQLTDTSRELQDRADLPALTNHIGVIESLERAERLRNTRTTGRGSRPGRYPIRSRAPGRQPAYGRNPQQYYQRRQPYSGQQSNYPRYQSQQHAQQGGRTGYPTRPAYGQGRGRTQGQRTSGRGGYQARNSGGQQSNYRGPPQQAPRPSDQYWQDDQGQQNEVYYQDDQGQEASISPEEQQLIDQWNDNMFVSSDTVNDQEWYANQEQYYVEDQQQQEDFYYGDQESGSLSEYQDAYEEDPQYLQQSGWWNP